MIKSTFITLKKNKKLIFWSTVFSLVGIFIIIICELIMQYIPNLPDGWVMYESRISDIRMMEVYSISVFYILTAIIFQPVYFQYIRHVYGGSVESISIRSLFSESFKNLKLKNVLIILPILVLSATIISILVFTIFFGILTLSFIELMIFQYVANIIILTRTILSSEMNKAYKEAFKLVIRNAIYSSLSLVPYIISFFKIEILTSNVFDNSYHAVVNNNGLIIKTGIINIESLIFWVLVIVVMVLLELLLIPFINIFVIHRTLEVEL